MTKIGSLIFLLLVVITSCSKRPYFDDDVVEIPKFNFPKTFVFNDNLSAYNIFDGEASNLNPSASFHLLELSSTLFTDYAHKQRLISIPEGAKVENANDGDLDYPNGTILVKTFYYLNDERNEAFGKNIIESRLLIKKDDKWNVATYIWNKDQTDAVLSMDGAESEIKWLNENKYVELINYVIPSQNDCFTCHQANSTITPLGPSIRNLNRVVNREGMKRNQIDYLNEIGLFDNISFDPMNKIVEVKDQSQPLELRARAYLDMNCSHCHNPDGWNKANQRRFDFRYEIPLKETGLHNQGEKVMRTLQNGKMPLIGTTVIDHEGVNLIKDYLRSL